MRVLRTPTGSPTWVTLSSSAWLPSPVEGMRSSVRPRLMVPPMRAPPASGPEIVTVPLTSVS